MGCAGSTTQRSGAARRNASRRCATPPILSLANAFSEEDIRLYERIAS